LPSFEKTHDAKVITLKSNTRWFTDSFAVQCYNGDKLHVAFAMDAFDRKIIGFIASTIEIDGAAIRDLILESLEYRFRCLSTKMSP
jgi:putative transposase